MFDYARWSEDESLRESDRDSWQLEEFIAECMQEQGFEYVPYVDPINLATPQTPGMSSEEVLGQAIAEGYGYVDEMVTYLASMSAASPNPNIAIMEKMSETEREAYWYALYPGTEDLNDGCAGQSFERQKAILTVRYEADTSEKIFEYPRFLSLYDKKGRVGIVIDESPEMHQAYAMWVDCMTDNGYSGFEGDWETSDYISNKLNTLVAPLQDNSDLTKEEILTGLNALKPELAALRKEEVALATQDAQCTIDSGIEGIRDKIIYAFEEEFIQENRAELDAFADALSKAQN